jgi:hypothetical protein
MYVLLSGNVIITQAGAGLAGLEQALAVLECADFAKNGAFAPLPTGGNLPQRNVIVGVWASALARCSAYRSNRAPSLMTTGETPAGLLLRPTVICVVHVIVVPVQRLGDLGG